ncbi:MAG TPA: IS200/IS605 family transposase [Lentisphaeria bacterium]|nr:IS200/IS605 family transposase [Lentisphaeria bacterium]
MGQSLSAVYIHIIFSTKRRYRFLDEEIRARMWQYLGGICNRLKCLPIQIGGMDDHAHLLTMLARDITLMELVGKLKSESSRWIKSVSRRHEFFAWQSGYGAFSINSAEKDRVVEYIVNQEAHHQRVDYCTEMRMFLDYYGIQCDERYLFDD